MLKKTQEKKQTKKIFLKISRRMEKKYVKTRFANIHSLKNVLRQLLFPAIDSVMIVIKNKLFICIKYKVVVGVGFKTNTKLQFTIK